jgi:hypothetical protein
MIYEYATRTGTTVGPDTEATRIGRERSPQLARGTGTPLCMKRIEFVLVH